MGMYDNVKYTANCLNCGIELSDWQSKDGPCELATLSPGSVRNFYTTCHRCDFWNEYGVTIEKYKVEPVVRNPYKWCNRYTPAFRRRK